MVQLTNFFNDQQAQVSPSHSRIVDALIARQQPVATTPIQGIANLANTTLLAVRAKRQEEEAAARRTGIQQTIVEAIAAGQPSSREVANPVVSALSKHPGGPPPLLSRTVTETVPGSVEDVLAVLGSNPDTAGFALQMQLGNLSSEEQETFTRKTGRELGFDNDDIFQVSDLTGETRKIADAPDSPAATFELVTGADLGVEGGGLFQRASNGKLTTLVAPNKGNAVKTLTVDEKKAAGFPVDAVVQQLNNDKYSVAYKVPGGSTQSPIEVSRDQLAITDTIVREQLSDLVAGVADFGKPVIDPVKRAAVAARVLELVVEGNKSVAEITAAIRGGAGGLTLANGQVIPEGSTFQQGDTVFIVENGQAVPFN